MIINLCYFHWKRVAWTLRSFCKSLSLWLIVFMMLTVCVVWGFFCSAFQGLGLRGVLPLGVFISKYHRSIDGNFRQICCIASAFASVPLPCSHATVCRLKCWFVRGHWKHWYTDLSLCTVFFLCCQKFWHFNRMVEQKVSYSTGKRERNLFCLVHSMHRFKYEASFGKGTWNQSISCSYCFIFRLS